MTAPQIVDGRRVVATIDNASGVNTLIKLQGMPAETDSTEMGLLLEGIGYDSDGIVFTVDSLENLISGACEYTWVRSDHKTRLQPINVGRVRLVVCIDGDGTGNLIRIQNMPLSVSQAKLSAVLYERGFSGDCMLIDGTDDDEHCEVYEWTAAQPVAYLRMVS